MGLARILAVEQVPRTISVWGDVIDDLAVVALIGGKDKDEGRRLARAARKWKIRFARDKTVRKLRLSQFVRGIDIKVVGRFAHVVLLIGPKALNKLIKRLARSAQ